MKRVLYSAKYIQNKHLKTLNISDTSETFLPVYKFFETFSNIWDTFEHLVAHLNVLSTFPNNYIHQLNSVLIVSMSNDIGHMKHLTF